MRRVLLLIVLCSATLAAQQAGGPPVVTSQDLLAGLSDPTKWLVYHGNYSGHRHSPLTQITPENVSRLTAQWTFQSGVLGSFQGTPIVIDNVLYETGFAGNSWALDARTGRPIWRHREEVPTDLHVCCGSPNRGFAVLGDRLFQVTPDAHVIALDMRTGALLWKATMADYKVGYSATVAAIVVKDKVIVGTAGAEFGTRGMIDAYDTQTGKRVWRFYTVAGPDDPVGGKTWPAGTPSYERGGGSIWTAGTYDPEQNLVFIGTGNPGPDYFASNREGDNLYTCSLVALDADTGKIKWHYQFSPHDVHDWDSTQVPVLADIRINGQPRKVVMLANRNGFFYVIDRVTGKMINAKPFVVQTWNNGFSPEGRPILVPGNMPNETGTRTCPDLGGGTNYFSPSYDPNLNLFFVTARDTCAVFYTWEQPFEPGVQWESGGSQRPRDWTNTGALRAIDPVTGDRKWEFKYPGTSASGVLTTATGLVFAGDGEGNAFALDSRTGKPLWHYQLGSGMRATGGTTYMVDGRQYYLVPAGSTLTAFAIPQ